MYVTLASLTTIGRLRRYWAERATCISSLVITLKLLFSMTLFGVFFSSLKFVVRGRKIWNWNKDKTSNKCWRNWCSRTSISWGDRFCCWSLRAPRTGSKSEYSCYKHTITFTFKHDFLKKDKENEMDWWYVYTIRSSKWRWYQALMVHSTLWQNLRNSSLSPFSAGEWL